MLAYNIIGIYVYINICTHEFDSTDSILSSIRSIFDFYDKLDSPGLVPSQKLMRGSQQMQPRLPRLLKPCVSRMS